MSMGSAVSGLAGLASGGMGQQSSGSTTSTQPYIMSGPSVYAANMAADAQINAAQTAAAAVDRSTNSALNTLMQQYSTSLMYANPAINTGNQAAAQFNYMLGLPAVSPGAAPVEPTLAGFEAKLTPDQVYGQIQQGLQYNTTVGNNPKAGNNPNAMEPVNTTASYTDPITGQVVSELTPGSLNNGTWGSGGTITAAQFINQASNKNQNYAGGNHGVQIAGGNTPGAGGLTGSLYKDTAQQLAQQQLDQALPAYQNQLNQYQHQQDVYNQYQAKGTATANDIGDIVQNLPGFQFQQQQGISGIQNAASASGMLNSGNTLMALNKFGQDLSQTYFQNYMNNLQSLASAGGAATQNAMNTSQNYGTQAAGQYANQGAAQANAALAAGQAAASSYLTPVANQQVIMTPYTTTSSSTSQSGGGAGGILSALSGMGGMF